MRSTLLVLATLLCSTWSPLSGPVDAAVAMAAQAIVSDTSSEIEALHVAWFKAFDTGDGAAMDRMETDNVVLILPGGTISPKTAPRAGSQPARSPQPRRALSDVTIRQFGETAVLTGLLTTSGGTGSSREATTVVFVRRSGRWMIASAQWGPATSGR